jgi:endogenous inhibitor of DNA gyrase (YacG/DUF329 family)
MADALDFADYCPVCGSVLPTNRWWCRKFCSLRCRQDDNNRVRRGNRQQEFEQRRARRARERAALALRCGHCGRPIENPRTTAQKFCGARCRTRAWYEANAEKQKGA